MVVFRLPPRRDVFCFSVSASKENGDGADAVIKGVLADTDGSVLFRGIMSERVDDCGSEEDPPAEMSGVATLAPQEGSPDFCVLSWLCGAVSGRLHSGQKRACFSAQYVTPAIISPNTTTSPSLTNPGNPRTGIAAENIADPMMILLALLIMNGIILLSRDNNHVFSANLIWMRDEIFFHFFGRPAHERFMDLRQFACNANVSVA